MIEQPGARSFGRVPTPVAAHIGADHAIVSCVKQFAGARFARASDRRDVVNSR
jgi:hypothetical protein